jgi:hypothetical protein
MRSVVASRSGTARWKTGHPRKFLVYISWALVMVLRQNKPEAWQLISRWLSASDTTGLGNEKCGAP